MTIRPTSIHCTATFDGRPPAELIASLFGHREGRVAWIPEPRRIAPKLGIDRKGFACSGETLTGLLAQKRFVSAREIRLAMGEYSSLAAFRIDGTEDAELSVWYGGRDIEDFGLASRAAVSILRWLLTHGGVHRGDVTRHADPGDTPPMAAIARSGTHAVVTTEREVAENYDEPEVFWSAWDTVEEHGDQRLCVRGLDLESGVDFLRYVNDSQRAMARAAKPGKTAYYLSSFDPEMQAFYEQEPSRLHSVGYLPDERRAEFSCALDSEEHVAGWEIDALYRMIAEKELDDGSALEEVRITFPDQEQAERDRRPLLDVGARLFFFDDGGELRELTD